MEESKYKSYDDLPLFLNAKWGPRGNAKRFRGERRNSEMSALSCLHGSKRYVACDDVSKATPLGRGRDNKNDIRVERRKDNR